MYVYANHNIIAKARAPIACKLSDAAALDIPRQVASLTRKQHWMLVVVEGGLLYLYGSLNPESSSTQSAVLMKVSELRPQAAAKLEV